MNKNLKVFIAIIYIICFCLLLFGFFNYIDVKQLSNYSYIKDSTQILISFKNDNLIIFSILFLIFSIIWVLLLGFASPVALVAGFVFGKFLGTLISVFGFTIGCTLLYKLASTYFRKTIINKLPQKVFKLKKLFNKSEFLYFLLFRLSGGGGIPFAIQNVMPLIFDMNLKNYFYSTFLGLVPGIFIIVSLGSGIEKIIENNLSPSFFSIITEPNIFIPIIAFILILIVSYFIKKFFFR